MSWLCSFANEWFVGETFSACRFNRLDHAFKVGSKTHVRHGVYKCKKCRKQFTVTVGTIFEASHIPLHKWVIAFHLLSAGKKGMNSHQLHRMLGITYKCAWHMTHRIRYAMQEQPMQEKLTGTVEVDETYVGGKERGVGRGQYRDSDKKQAVVALVQRGGKVRTFPVERVTLANVGPILKKHIAKSANVDTDESMIYKNIKPWLPRHRTVNHTAREYVRHENNRMVTTNTVEGFFSLVKRSVYGTYHHWSKHHMHRYLAELEFRYNRRGLDDGGLQFVGFTDETAMRTDRAIRPTLRFQVCTGLLWRAEAFHQVD